MDATEAPEQCHPTAPTNGHNKAGEKRNTPKRIKKVKALQNLLDPIDSTDEFLARYDSPSELREFVQLAIEGRKIYATNRTSRILHLAFRRRGWLQKPLLYQDVDYSSITYNSEYIRKSLANAVPSFIWTKRQHLEKNEYGPHTIRNPILRKHECNFTLKIGLATLYEKMHWFDLTEPGVISFPRSHTAKKTFQKGEFSDDFRLTSCTSFLYTLTKYSDLADVFSPDATITSECIVFAMGQVQRACDKKCHKDIDHNSVEAPSKKTFQAFNQCFQKILREQQRVKITNGVSVEQFVAEIQELMKEALNLFPHIAIDGSCNAWILKPGYMNRGIGIEILDDEDAIMDFIRRTNNCSYVIQKYIERPLLIYNTKFDIRQYFIVTADARHLNIWMYKNCYLKLSGQQFSLNNYTRSVHLTNHTVQKYYVNGERSPELPDHNMWSLQDFRIYLSKNGASTAWQNKIYPGMIKAISSVIYASMDNIIHRRNSFEFFGADFLISENFDPILLEINASPDLSASTVITQHICAAVIEDLVKVIADYPKDSSSPTGNFENVFRLQVMSISRPYCDICIKGVNQQKKKLSSKLCRGSSSRELRSRGSTTSSSSSTSTSTLQERKINRRYQHVKSKYKDTSLATLSESTSEQDESEKEEESAQNIRHVKIIPINNILPDFFCCTNESLGSIQKKVEPSKKSPDISSLTMKKSDFDLFNNRSDTEIRKFLQFCGTRNARDQPKLLPKYQLIGDSSTTRLKDRARQTTLLNKTFKEVTKTMQEACTSVAHRTFSPTNFHAKFTALSNNRLTSLNKLKSEIEINLKKLKIEKKDYTKEAHLDYPVTVTSFMSIGPNVDDEKSVK